MTKNLNRTLKRANRYLEIIEKFISDYEDTLKDERIYDWIVSNSDIMQEEIEEFGYGNDDFYCSHYTFKNEFGSSYIYQIIKNFPKLVKYNRIRLEIDREEGIKEAYLLSKIIREHLLKFIQRAKEKIEDNEIVDIKFEEELKKLNPDLILKKYALYLRDDKEINIFLENLKSLKRFEHNNNYKYCMIAMGSILEFLLDRYCAMKNIKPVSYSGRSGKNFSNYLQAAIDNKIFGDKKYWELIQRDLRDFRNYVHIQKEVKNPTIDFNWHKIIKPAFDRLLKEFQKASLEELTP